MKKIIIMKTFKRNGNYYGMNSNFYTIFFVKN